MATPRLYDGRTGGKSSGPAEGSSARRPPEVEVRCGNGPHPTPLGLPGRYTSRPHGRLRPSKSIEAFESKGPPVHKSLLGTGIAVLEALDMEEVTPGPYALVAHPTLLL